MKSGFNILWTEHALRELQETFQHLEAHWSQKEIQRLSEEIEATLKSISENPLLFQETNVKNVRRAVVLRLNSIFYHLNTKKKQVTILAFFDNRKDPSNIF